VSKIDEKNVSRVLVRKILLSEHAVVKSYSSRIIDQSSDVQFSNFSCIEVSLSLGLGQVSGYCQNGFFIFETGVRDDLLKLIEVCCGELLWDKGFFLTLIVDFEHQFSGTDIVSGGTELCLGSKHRILSGESEESSRSRYSVSEIGFHFDVSCLSNVPFGSSEAYYAGSLSKVCLVGDAFDSSSFGDCYLACEATNIDTD